MSLLTTHKQLMPKTNACEFCGIKNYTTKKYITHALACARKSKRKKRVQVQEIFKCKYCPTKFKTHYLLECHVTDIHQYTFCDRKFTDHSSHILTHAQYGGSLSTKQKHQLIKLYKKTIAFRGFIETYKHTARKKYGLEQYLHLVKNPVKTILCESLNMNNAIKSQMSLYVKFKRRIFTNMTGRAVYEFQKKLIHGYMLMLLNEPSIAGFYKKTSSKLESTINIFQEYGSGWVMDRILGSTINVGKYSPMKGGCKFKIPDEIKRNHATINIQRVEKDCFKYAFLASIHCLEVVKHRERPSSYIPYEQLYDFSGLKNPVEVKAIPAFEEKNNCVVNVFGWEKGVIPLYISSNNYQNLPTANVLLLSNMNEDHYVTITDLNKLLRESNHHGKLVCFYCLSRIPRCKSLCGNPNCDEKCKLMDHIENCSKFKYQKVHLPKVKDGVIPTIEFKNFGNQMKAGYVIYCDFEALITDSEEFELKDDDMRDMTTTKVHKISGFSYVVIKSDSSIITHRTYQGEDSIEVLSELSEIVQKIISIYKINVELVMSDEDELTFDSATLCHICRKPFGDDDIVVRDHDHLTSKFRGAAHQACNFNFQPKKKVPIIMHNFRGYDSHLLIPGLEMFGEKISVVPTNSENFMSMSIDDMYFIDSLQFLNESLATLVSNLEAEEFYLLDEIFDHDSAKLLRRKGVYPYDYMNSFARFEEKKLPPKKNFFNNLRKENISDEDYIHAQKVFKHFKMNNMGDYHDIYLLSDTILLACVFERFRKLSLENYSLDPVYYISAPGLTFDAALKMTGQTLELITDVDQYEFLEAGIRGGVSQICLRKAEADNKYMESYKGSEDNPDQSYIMYWDMNNLYGRALACKLPVAGFRWLNDYELKTFDVSKVPSDSDVGFVVCCDLEYPVSKHDSHRDLPLAVEKKAVPISKFSNYQKTLLENLEINYMETQEKLLAHLEDRENYITYHENLKFYLQNGLKLKRVRKVLMFRQEAWLKPYVMFNTQKRTQAKNEFEKDFYKLLNNSLYGKSMENVRKRVRVEIVNSAEKAKTLIQKPTYKTHHILQENLALFNLEKSSVLLNKAIYTGFVVLELSKLFMNKFHYEFIMPLYRGKAWLLMMDTDSFAYLIVTNDVYEDMKAHADWFDTSDYPEGHPNFSLINKKVIGKMKDEAKGNLLYKFIGLGPKSYCFLGSMINKKKLKENFEKKAMKGVPKFIQKRSVTFNTFENILNEQSLLVCKYNQIRSVKHTLVFAKVSKSATHGFDSKRYIQDDGINTLPFGHYSLK